MGKGKKQAPNELVFFKGLALSLGVYLLGLLIITVLVVKGALSEESMFPLTAIFCVAAALAGGFLCARHPAWGALPNAMLCAAIFVSVLAGMGLLCWDGISWTGHGGILILCALGGGMLAGLLGSRRGGRGKRRRK